MSYVKKLEHKSCKKGAKEEKHFFQAVFEIEAIERAYMPVKSIEKERPETK